jgi:hypothetical protein
MQEASGKIVSGRCCIYYVFHIFGMAFVYSSAFMHGNGTLLAKFDNGSLTQVGNMS